MRCVSPRVRNKALSAISQPTAISTARNNSISSSPYARSKRPMRSRSSGKLSSHGKMNLSMGKSPAKKRKAKTAKAEIANLDLTPDAWEKFERLIKNAAEMGHKPHVPEKRGKPAKRNA